ncbi:hypothetical protein ES705_47499 [subsurface metagenome]
MCHRKGLGAQRESLHHLFCVRIPRLLEYLLINLPIGYKKMHLRVGTPRLQFFSHRQPRQQMPPRPPSCKHKHYWPTLTHTPFLSSPLSVIPAQVGIQSPSAIIPASFMSLRGPRSRGLITALAVISLIFSPRFYRGSLPIPSHLQQFFRYLSL